MVESRQSNVESTEEFQAKSEDAGGNGHSSDVDEAVKCVMKACDEPDPDCIIDNAPPCLVGLSKDGFGMAKFILKKWSRSLPVRTLKSAVEVYRQEKASKEESPHRDTSTGKSTKSIPAPVIEDIEDILAKEYTKVEWHIKDIWATGLTLLVSAPKAGKSITLLDMCQELARRLPGYTAYLSLEDDGSIVQDRMQDLLDGREIGREKLGFVWEVMPIGKGLIEQLKYIMYVRPDCKRIIIDVFAQVMPHLKSGDVFLGSYESLKPLQKFANENGIAILVAHHTNKRPKNGEDDIFNRINGPQGLLAAVDAGWIINRIRGKNEVTMTLTGRRYKLGDVTVKFQLGRFWDTHKVVIEEEATSNVLGDSRQKVITVLQGADEYVSQRDIASKSGLNVWCELK